MKILVCGSMAYDNIMVFHDRFKNHILPEKIHILNVAFVVPEMRREFGGCAGNIAYSLKLLGGDPLIMATIGEDGELYRTRLAELDISQQYLRTVPGTFTAQAFITTDLDDNQITAFHPGAMSHAHLNHVQDAGSIELGIVAPDGREAMLQHVHDFHGNDIPFLFDPGQNLPLFTGEELLHCLQLADYCAMNDYEAQMMVERTGQSIEALAGMVKAFIVTLGAQGSKIYLNGQCLTIPSAVPTEVLDPTGCGDAYRAGLLYGIAKGLNWEETGRLASLMGSLKIAHRGAQNHLISREEIAVRYRAAFGASIW